MKSDKKNGVFDLAQQAILQPKEALATVSFDKKKTRIGIPREMINQEKRIPFTPQAIQILTSMGYEIIIENGAGLNAKFSDHEYSEAGARIIYNKKEIFKSDIIIKIAFPTIEELEMMDTHQMLLSVLDLPHLDLKKLNILFQKKITCACYEYIKDDFGGFPVIQCMSEIAGRTAIFIAAEYLAKAKGNGILLGGITGVAPAQVVILGAGTVGQYAARAANALGADVKVFDNSIYKLRRLHSVHSLSLFNSIIQPNLIRDALKTADVVIGALRPEHGKTPCVVTEEMVILMKDGSVIIDVSIDQGGCFETSHVTNLDDPTYVKYNVIHYCVPNIPSSVPQTASQALSNILTPLLADIANFTDLESFLWEKPYARSGIYIYKGILTNLYLGEKFGINSQNIDLLLTTQL
jgi:alanine dehydrogenase